MSFQDYPLHQFDQLPAFWLAAIQQYIAGLTPLLRITQPTLQSLRLQASSSDLHSLSLDGLWRFNIANQDATHPGGPAASYDIVVATSANNIVSSPDPFTDDTDYTFYLYIEPTGSVPSGNTPAGNAIVATRKIGECDWDGTNITGYRQLIGASDTTQPIQPTSPSTKGWAVRAVAASGQDPTKPISWVQSFNGSATYFAVYTTGAVASALTVTNGTTLSGTLTVQGTASFQSNVSMAANLTVTGTLGAGVTTLSRLTVTGNASVGGTLSVAGATTLANVTAGAVGANSVGVAGATTTATLSVTGNASVGGTLSVTGSATLAGGATSVTPAPGDNTTKVATTEFVQTAIAALPSRKKRQALRWTPMGPLQVPSGETGVLNGNWVVLAATEAASIVEILFKLDVGTATIELWRTPWGGSPSALYWAGAHALSVTTSPTSSTAATVALSNRDFIQPIVTAASSDAQNLSLAVAYESTL